MIRRWFPSALLLVVAVFAAFAASYVALTVFVLAALADPRWLRTALAAH
ncbi:hypothetical protein [Actinoplanes sp. NPDC051494]